MQGPKFLTRVSDFSCLPSVITVQARKADHTDIDLPDNPLLSFSLDSEGEKYGTLTGPNGISGKVLAGISYQDANAGEVKYLADGEEPDSTVKVNVTVFKVEDMDIQGEGEVVIVNEPELVLEIMDANDAVTDTLHIARWDNAYHR